MTMGWINQADCASSLRVVEYPNKSDKNTHQNSVVARAYDGLDNEHFYDDAKDFVKYCISGKKQKKGKIPQGLAKPKLQTPNPIPEGHQGDTVTTGYAPDTFESGFKCEFTHGGLFEPGFKSEFSEGDHICWGKSGKGVKYHGIVVSVHESDMAVIYWRKLDGKAEVVEKQLDAGVENIFLNEHPERIRHNNPPDAVVARARAHMGQSKFRNGKDFAMSCLAGIEPSSTGCTDWYGLSGSGSPDSDSLEQPQSMALPTRTPISVANFKHSISVGDHITWHRPYVI